MSLSCSCSEHLAIRHVRTGNHFRKAILSTLITLWCGISPTSNKTLIWNVSSLHWSPIQCHLWQSWHISDCKDSNRLPKTHTHTQIDIPIRAAQSYQQHLSTTTRRQMHVLSRVHYLGQSIDCKKTKLQPVLHRWHLTYSLLGHGL